MALVLQFCSGVLLETMVVLLRVLGAVHGCTGWTTQVSFTSLTIHDCICNGYGVKTGNKQSAHAMRLIIIRLGCKITPQVARKKKKMVM